MRSEVVDDVSTRRITIEITDGPAMDVTERWHAKPRSITARRAQIEIDDGVTQRITVSGPLIKKDGSESDRLTDKIGYGLHAWRSIEQAPGWVQQLFREAPAGVTGWAV